MGQGGMVAQPKTILMRESRPPSGHGRGGNLVGPFGRISGAVSQVPGILYVGAFWWAPLHPHSLKK